MIGTKWWEIEWEQDDRVQKGNEYGRPNINTLLLQMVNHNMAYDKYV